MPLQNTYWNRLKFRPSNLDLFVMYEKIVIIFRANFYFCDTSFEL